jgi:hypothetical protein
MEKIIEKLARTENITAMLTKMTNKTLPEAAQRAPKLPGGWCLRWFSVIGRLDGG